MVNVLTKRGETAPGTRVDVSLGSLGTGRATASVGHVFDSGNEMLFAASGYRSRGDDRLYFPEFDVPGVSDGVFVNGDGDRSASILTSTSIGRLRFTGSFVDRAKHIPTLCGHVSVGVPHSRPSHLGCLLMIVLVGVISRPSVSAQVDEALVKAAALLRVPLFVDWPATSLTERFVIAVAPDEDFTQKVVEAARGRRVHNHAVHVKRLGDSDESCGCHMLFVGIRGDSRSAALLRWARGKPVRTVGETTAFLREGGIVRVFRDDNRLRLQINNKTAEGAGLKISSRLLQLADQTP